jgi:hypothetical protein
MSESLQDSFTDHFYQPDVPDPWSRLLEVNSRYWPHWLTFTPMNVTLLAGCVVGGWAMWRRDRFVAVLVLACGALAFALTAAHPEVSQGDRLYVLAWLGPVVGLPMAVQRPATRVADERPPFVGCPAGRGPEASRGSCDDRES